MFVYETQLRVRYAETDQMGYVYYGNYATYYEVARVEAFRFLEFSYKKLEDEKGIMMPVYEMNTRYHQPAKYDDLLTLRVKIPQLPSVRVKFEYEIFNEEGVLLNTGETTLVFVEKSSNKICRCPAPLVEKLRAFYK
jgi:acyl-CoA thioester hydrolase